MIVIILLLNKKPAENHNKNIIWFNFQEYEQYSGNIKYDTKVSKFLNNINYSDDKILKDSNNADFLNISLFYLKQIYAQNPEFKEGNPTNIFNDSKISMVMNISYAVNEKNNVYDFGLSSESDYCTTGKSFYNVSKEDIYYKTEDFIENLADCLVQAININNSEYVFIGPDHSFSYLTVNLAKKINSKSKIGLFVFDEHIDIYGLKDSGNMIGKENVFGKLLLEGYVDYVVFIGTSDIAKSYVKRSVNENFTKNEMFDKIAVYSDSDFKHQNWQSIIKNEIYNMKKRGITNVIVSVDVDVLPTQYTGFEYSILAPAIGVIKHGKNHTGLTLAEIPEGFSNGLKPEELSKQIIFVKFQALKRGMAFGVENKNIKIFGDIQELLPNQDIDFETTKAAKEILKAFFPD